MRERVRSMVGISAADRHTGAVIVRVAAGDGRLDFDELDERLEAAYAAKTYAELVPITQDLAPAVTSGGAVVKGVERERAVAIMGGVERRGIWTVPEHFSVFCFWGGAELDLREAQFSAPEVTLTVNVLMGGANIVVNPSTHVIVHGTGIMGGYSAPRSDPSLQLTADSPTVRQRGPQAEARRGQHPRLASPALTTRPTSCRAAAPAGRTTGPPPPG